MAANKKTAYLAAYQQLTRFIPFLSTFFTTNPRDIVNAESVKIDIMRGTQKMAPVISNITQRGGVIEKSQYTNKEFTPPVVALAGNFAPGDLVEKAFGMSEYDSAQEEYQMTLQNNIMDTMLEIETQFGRTIEDMVAQILQTGELTLKDANGNDAYTIDFFPKATHFVTVSTPWSSESADPDNDIKTLMRVIEKDGMTKIQNVVFTPTALKEYLGNAKVADKFDITRVSSGIYSPVVQEAAGVTYLGSILVGNRYLDCWEFDVERETLGGTTMAPYLTDGKVLLLPNPGGPNVDLRIVYCRVPTITGVDPRFASIVPVSMNMGNRAYTARVWVDGGADELQVELKTRPLAIPVSIDCFGCLTT